MSIQRTPTKNERIKILDWIADDPCIRLAEVNKLLETTGSDLDLTRDQLGSLRKKARVKYAKQIAAIEDDAITEGLARRAARVAEKQERHGLLKQIIRERGAHESMMDAPGGSTGLLVRDYKAGSYQPVYKLDAALLREMQELEKEIAIELGQRTEKRELSGPDGGAIPIAINEMLDKMYNGKDEQKKEQSDPDSQ